MRLRDFGTTALAGLGGRPRLQQFRHPARPRRDRRGRACGARRRHHPVRHRRHLRQPRRLRDAARRGAGRAPQGHRAGHQIRPADGRQRPPPGRLAPLRARGGRGEPAPAQHRLDRRLLLPSARPEDADRGDAGRARRARARRQGPPHRLLEFFAGADRRRAGGRATARPCPPSSPRRTSTACWRAGSSATSCRRSNGIGSRCCPISRSPAAC